MVQAADGTLVPHTRAEAANLKVETTLDIPAWGEQGQGVAVMTSMMMLRREAHKKTLDEYAELCDHLHVDMNPRNSSCVISFDQC